MLLKRFLFPLLLFIFFAFIYLHNLSSDIYGGDVGDLVTAAYTMGVAHPPGYPLFVLLGFIFSHIFPFGEVAFRVGLISASSAALGILFFYLTTERLTKNILLSFLAATILGTNFLYWFYAEIAEVFALHACLTIILFYLAISFNKTHKSSYLLLLSFLLGLAMTNHHTSVLIFPSLLIIIFTPLKKLFLLDWKLIIYCILLALLGFSVYLYVPLASSRHPVVNWDQVHDISSFLRLVLRTDYGTFSAGKIDAPSFWQRIIILQNYGLTIGSQMTIPAVFVSLCGVFYLLKKEKTITIALLIAFLLSGPFFIGYAGFPLYSTFNLGVYERFFLMSSIIFLFFFPFGMLFLLSLIKPYFHRISLFAIQAVFFLIPFMLFIYNFPKTNLSHVSIGNNLSKDMLSTLPKNSVLLLAGDTTLFNAWYVHYVLNVRPDVLLLNSNGLVIEQFFQKKQNEYEKKHGKITNQHDIVIKTLEYTTKERTVFSESSFKVDDNYTWVPSGLLYRLTEKTHKPSISEYDTNQQRVWRMYHLPKRDATNLALGSFTISEIPTIYSNSLLVNGYYFFSEYKNSQKALPYFLKAKQVDPTNRRVYEVLGIYYATIDKDCENAEEYLSKAIELNPFDKVAYYTLYGVASRCHNNQKIKQEVVKQYKEIFLTDFTKDMPKTDKKKE